MRLNLKCFRVNQQMSQEEMAERVGCIRATYSGIESGKRDGRLAFWHDLQKAFNIPDEKMWALMKHE